MWNALLSTGDAVAPRERSATASGRSAAPFGAIVWPPIGPAARRSRMTAAVLGMTVAGALAQETSTSTQTKTFEVITVEGNRLVVRLPEGTRGDIDARGVQPFRMTRGLGAKLAKALQLVEREIVAGDVEQAVEQSRTVAGGENEAIAIRPLRILGVEVHELGEEDVGHGGGAERQTGVAGVCGLHRVDGEDAESVDGFGFELSIERGGSDGGQENLLERRRGERKRHAAGALRQAGGGVSPVTGKYPM